MDNYQIAENFSMLSMLLDIHGENSFKSKSYSSAAFAIEKFTTPITQIPVEKISSIKGIGASSAQKIIELLTTGKLQSLEEIVLNTPPGIVEMLNIKGIGPKKINTIWKEMQVESIGELMYACQENRLKLFKGFGEKTQQNVADSIEFYLKSKGSFLYSQVADAAKLFQSYLTKLFPQKRIALTGAFKRQLEVINELEFIIENDVLSIEKKLMQVEGFQLVENSGKILIYNSSTGIKLKIHASTPADFVDTLVRSSSSAEFMEEFSAIQDANTLPSLSSEETVFAAKGLQFIPSPLRETASVLTLASVNSIPAVIQPEDIRGIIHSHSNWSDGSNTIEEMARAAMERGLEYLVVSDHSKSAFYAQGLQEEKIREQHRYIDELNIKLAPFRIFKSIESDILNDGSLDYSNEVLATFDLVIVSIHSNLKMTEEKAMSRLLKAIENPYTTILGHLTGRLLLSRPGYPVDHDAIIEACAANNVIIELNAHPSRLDMDWRYISKALDKNVLISIDPDAHFIDGLDDTFYGVMVAQKAMVTKTDNLSSYTLQEFEKFIVGRKVLKNI